MIFDLPNNPTQVRKTVTEGVGIGDGSKAVLQGLTQKRQMRYVLPEATNP